MKNRIINALIADKKLPFYLHQKIVFNSKDFKPGIYFTSSAYQTKQYTRKFIRKPISIFNVDI